MIVAAEAVARRPVCWGACGWMGRSRCLVGIGRFCDGAWVLMSQMSLARPELPFLLICCRYLSQMSLMCANIKKRLSFLFYLLSKYPTFIACGNFYDSRVISDNCDKSRSGAVLMSQMSLAGARGYFTTSECNPTWGAQTGLRHLRQVGLYAGFCSKFGHGSCDGFLGSLACGVFLGCFGGVDCVHCWIDEPG